MNPSIALKVNRLKKRALSFGMINAFDQAMQFVLPVILVRCLDTATFGEYRLLWLVVGTVMAVATLNMAGGLFIFLPRSDAMKKRLYINQTLLFLAVMGLACAAIVGPWDPLLPAAAAPLAKYGGLVPAFVALWVTAILLDVLPTVDERVRWQAFATLTVATLRLLLVGLGAWGSGDLTVILWLLVAVVGIKLALLVSYISRHHRAAAPIVDRAVFADQFVHSAPLGLAASLYGLRKQADQWVVAALFPLGSFAAFSIAAAINPLIYVFRTSLIQAFLPSMSRLEASGDVRSMLEMSARGNVLLASLLYPVLAFVFAFADDIVTLVYTASYLEAAPVMRMYIVGYVALVIELGSVLLLLRQGPFALCVHGTAIVLSVSVGWALAGTVGLVGAAAGSVIAIWMDRAVTLRRIARLSGIAMRELQDWRGLATAFGYAAASAALAWVMANFLGGEAVLSRLVVGGAVLAIAYLPILARWRSA
jgi:O-antigen/teichoic acid export membrane protein